MEEQVVVFVTLVGALVLFVNGRIRYDVVALLALLAVTITGVIPQEEAFAGFGHPAVITVAAVLVISRGLLNAGVVDAITRWLGRVGDNITLQIGVLMTGVTIFSSFMNNIGALALMMPVAIRLARKSGHSPSLMLMPLAFGSLLGGLTTLIGTPPNIIIATFRAGVKGQSFGMFDYTPVGLGVALAGGAFITLVGWRLIPKRRGQASRDELFRIGEYISEVRIPEESELARKPLRELFSMLEMDVVVVALVRGERRLIAPSSFETIRAGDILLVEATPDELKELVDRTKFELVGSKVIDEDALKSGSIGVMEAIVTVNSPMRNRTARGINLRWRYGVNLLAVARQGERLQQRLGRIRFRAGDILLLQGHTDTLYDALTQLGCLPLAERELHLGKPRRLALAVGIFGGALALTTTGLLSIQVALMSAMIGMLLVGMLSLREAYDSIDWPIIVLLGAMIPVGQALETSGGAQRIADSLLRLSQQMPPVVTLALVLVATMFLSDIINNAAATVLMAPIALNVARGLGASADPFLMAVAIGASCAFLTPIGHQSNTLVMGPGGYRFGDYWRMGLPLEIVIFAVSIPLILIFWPLGI